MGELRHLRRGAGVGLIRRPVVFTALFFATFAAVFFGPLLWGSTWMLDNGRPIGFLIGIAFHSWWLALEPRRAGRHRRQR